MKRNARLRAVWSSVLQGAYLAALTVALVAFGLRVGDGVQRVRSGEATPAEAISSVAAWLRGDG